MTLEERIALRTDAELARERIRIGKRVQTSGVPATPELIADAFDGKTHPELFLPTQVFDQLLDLAFLGAPRMGQDVRKSLMSDVARHGLPADFWERLRVLSTVYLVDTLAERDLGQSLSNQRGLARQRAAEGLAVKRADVCRSRAEALAAARKEFGPERFDRFLYEVIAVNMFSVADRLPDPEILRQTERGCR